jgi:hypothetical protein
VQTLVQEGQEPLPGQFIVGGAAAEAADLFGKLRRVGHFPTGAGLQQRLDDCFQGRLVCSA